MVERTKKRKRREPFGAIRQRSSGRYQASYTAPDGNRYNAPRTFDNMTDARAWLAIQRARIVDGTWGQQDAARQDAGKTSRSETFGDYARQWIATRVNRHGDHLRPRTRIEYERLLDGPLEPFQSERLNLITTETVRAWQAEQMASGHKTQTARAYGLLKSVLQTALVDGRIQTNPCNIRGAANSTTGRKVVPPTSAELQKMVDSITPRYRAAVLIAAWAGCRYGELTELRRKDVRVEDDAIVIDVSRAVTHTVGQGFIVGKTKSEAGVRSIALPPHIRSSVLEHLEKHVGRSPNALLFPAADGVSHLAQSTFVKHWYPAREAAKRKDMPFHALRHYGATRYAQTGATLKEIQARIGHSTVAAAMRYQHTAGRDAELARRMSELE